MRLEVFEGAGEFFLAIDLVCGLVVVVDVLFVFVVRTGLVFTFGANRDFLLSPAAGRELDLFWPITGGTGCCNAEESPELEREYPDSDDEGSWIGSAAGVCKDVAPLTVESADDRLLDRLTAESRLVEGI